MSNGGAQVFILSDLHIENSKDPMYASFLEVLNTKPTKSDVVVLAGDIFDFWVGNRDIFKNEYAAFLEALKRLKANQVQVYYIEGNHDFHLKSALSPYLNLNHRSIEFKLDDKNFFVAHGDLVNLADVGYLLLRFLFRSPLISFLVKIVPEGFLKKLGEFLSKKSRQYNPRIRNSTRTKFRNYAVIKIQKGYDFVALGHCHDDDQMTFKIGDRTGAYANVGFPKVHKTYLYWKEGQSEFQKVKFPHFNGS